MSRHFTIVAKEKPRLTGRKGRLRLGRKAAPQISKPSSDELSAYRVRLEKIKQQLRSIREIKGSLDILASAGADPERILHILAIEVARYPWERQGKTAKSRLKSAAKRLRHLAAELEQLYRDAKIYPDLLAVAYREIPEDSVPSLAERLPSTLIREMRQRAAELEDFDRQWGQSLKTDIPVRKRRTILHLLMYVHGKTGDVRPHFVRLSSLLADVYEKFPNSRRRAYSPGSLEKHFKRYITRADKTPS